MIFQRLRYVVVAIIISAAAGVAIGAPTESSSSDKAAELKALLKERRNTLNNIVDLRFQRWQAGKDVLEVVLKAQRELLRANLELLDDPKERMAALQDCLETAKKIQKINEEKLQAGLATQADALEAKTAMQEIQIEILREELKAKK